MNDKDNPELDPGRIFRQIGNQLEGLPKEMLVYKLIDDNALRPELAERLLNKRPTLLKAIAVIALGGGALYAMGKRREADINTLAEEIGFGPEIEYKHKQTVQRALDFLHGESNFVEHNKKRSRWSRWILGDTARGHTLDTQTAESRIYASRRHPSLESWYGSRNCRGEDPDMFDPSSEDKVERDELIVWAKGVCADCKVRQDCLDFALRNKEESGVWGGMTTPERKTLLKRRKAGKETD